VLTSHDEAELAFTATRPMAFQVDGEYMGERENMNFMAIPNALRVIV
jgi:diacylglycerol kinase family enzyme